VCIQEERQRSDYILTKIIDILEIYYCFFSPVTNLITVCSSESNQAIKTEGKKERKIITKHR